MPESDDIAEMAAKSPTRRRARKRALANSGVSLELTVILGAPGTIPGDLPDTSVITLFCAAMVVGYSYRVIILSSRWGLRRSARRVWNRSPGLQRNYEEVITEEALTVRTEGVTHSTTESVPTYLICADFRHEWGWEEGTTSTPKG